MRNRVEPIMRAFSSNNVRGAVLEREIPDENKGKLEKKKKNIHLRWLKIERGSQCLRSLVISFPNSSSFFPLHTLHFERTNDAQDRKK